MLNTFDGARRKAPGSWPPALCLGRWGAIVLLLGTLLGTNGCTLILGATGAVIDAAVITSPIWGPGVVNREKQKFIQRDVGVLLPAAQIIAEDRSTLSGAEPSVLVQPFDGPPETRKPLDHYFPWLGMAPLVPYANAQVDVTAATPGRLPDHFAGPSTGETRTLRFPLSSFPDSLRPTEGASVSGNVRKVASALAWEQLVSIDPSKEDLAVAYCKSNRERYLFGVTVLAQEVLDRSLTGRVALQMPQATGRYGFAPIQVPAGLVDPDQKPPDQKGHADIRFGRLMDVEVVDCPPTVEFSVVSGNECQAVVPPVAYQVTGSAAGYPVASAEQIVVTGQIRALRLEISNISYGVTYLGAHLLSLFGLPLSSNRLAMELDVLARRGGDRTPVLERSYSLATRRRTVSLYYGGRFAEDLNEELMGQMEEAFRQFAAELEPLARATGPVASAASERGSR